MKRLLRKTFVGIALFALLLVSTDCKKQKRCGCGKDVLYDYGGASYVYFDSENITTISMMQVNNFYDTYSFCNPDEVKSKLVNVKSGEELMVFGYVYWDCNFVMQQSGSYYQPSYYRAYNIYVTDIYVDMYGKDNSNEELKKGF